MHLSNFLSQKKIRVVTERNMEEKFKMFSGMRFRKLHSAHTQRRANIYKKEIESTHEVRVEKINTNWYLVWGRKK